MLKTLIKMQFSALGSQMLKRTIKGRSTNQTSAGKAVLFSVLLIVVFAYLSVMFGGLFFLLLNFTANTELNYVAISAATFLSTVLCFVGTVFSIQSTLFNSKDNDLLISMPIPPRLILLSRLAAIAILNYFFALLVFLPAEISWIAVCGFDFSAVMIFILFLVVPMLSMALTLIIGWLIALISSKMRNKNLVTTILSVIAFGAYFVLCFNLGGYISAVEENPEIVTSLFSEYLGLFVIMGKAAASLDAAAILITLAVCIIPFAIVYFILSKSFLKIVTNKKSAKKTVYVKKEMKTASVRTALLKKEFGRFFSSAAYFLNGFMGVIFTVLVAALFIIDSGSVNGIITEISAEFGIDPSGFAALIGIVILVMLSAFDLPTSVSISLEGKTLWILQSMPIRTTDVLIAKVRAAVLATAVPNLILAAVISAVFPIGIIHIIPVFITAVAMPVFCSCLGLCINMLMPRFDWVNETICIKQSGSAIVSLLASIGAAIILITAGFILTIFISAEVGVSFLLVITVAIAVVFDIIVRKCFEKRFKDLG